LAWIRITLIAAALALFACTTYNPSVFVSYDVLNPGAAVRLNPLGFTDTNLDTRALEIVWDKTLSESLKVPGLYIVNMEFLAWVDELKQEVLRLRKGK
jgi:hypothetical protein